MVNKYLILLLLFASITAFATTESLQSSGETAVGEAAPWLSGWTLADEVFNTQKVFKDESINRVALVFWASWCAPCKKGIKELNKHSAEFNEHGIKVVLVNSAESEEVVREYCGENGPLFTVVLDPYSKNRETYMPSPLPKTVLIGRDGKVEAIFGKEDTDYVQRIINGK
ncbi:MAG: redoxin domain-containing protein [bacterium]|nr:redoxin domain-containing protein [bacterium]